MDDDNPHATVLAVKDGRLLYVGSDSGLPLHFMYHLPPLLSFFHSQKGPPQLRRALDCRKTASAKGFGGKDSVKENRQGFLSRRNHKISELV